MFVKIIQNIKPHEFYNLAAQSFVGKSWDLSKSTTEVNAIGVLNILNAIRNNYKYTKFYQASTSEIFGNSNDKIQTEKLPSNQRHLMLYLNYMHIGCPLIIKIVLICFVQMVFCLIMNPL